MDIELIHRRMAEAVNGAQLKGNNLQVTATPYIPRHFEPPHFYMFNWRIRYDRTFSPNRQNMHEFTTTWHLALAFADDEAAEQEASALSGSGEQTIRDVILDARGAPGEYALGGAADDIRPVTASGPNEINVGDVHLLVVEFVFDVIGH